MSLLMNPLKIIFFFFNDTATTEIYPFSLHDALPISAYGYGEVPPRELVSYRSAEPFLARVDDRPSTGPLGRSEKAALVSGSSSALLGRGRPAYQQIGRAHV